MKEGFEVAYQNIAVDIYQAASPAVGERLFDDDMLKDIYYICEELFRKRNRILPYPREEVEEYFEEFHTIISFFKHVEITLVLIDIDWSALLDELIHQFPQIAWIGGSKETEDQRITYYLDFVPIAYKETDFPFVVNLTSSLQQQLGIEEEGVEFFIKKIERLVSKHIKPFPKVEKPQPQQLEEESIESETENVRVFEDRVVRKNSIVLEMEEAIKQERMDKEKVQIANKKLEVVIEQMERQGLSRAMKELSKQADQDNENWSQVLKVDLREYSQLLQKAKFLEQSWAMNKDLITKSETMTISTEKLTYEREQVRTFKEWISTNEIYLILDECKLIESRVKIKKRAFFNQPHVRIMRMDYDSLLNKAAYFDLIQGENYLLEKIIK